ncbi:MAG: hypothetical protein R3C04_02850 [Hyphomonas sp.]
MRSLLIHEDNSVLVFNKPVRSRRSGRRRRQASLDSLLAAFAKSNGKRRALSISSIRGHPAWSSPRAPSRLPRLSDEFATRRAKVYLALVRGTLPEAASGVIDAPLVKVEEADAHACWSRRPAAGRADGDDKLDHSRQLW